MAIASGHAEEGLELLSVGVGIFDSDLRLTFCNSAFRSLRQYPADLCCDGISLRALLRFNAERGDFGVGVGDEQVAERLAEITTSGERQLEREMASGQVLQIRYRPTASGGVVITYQDCTAERKAERALRASEERYSLVSEAAEEAIYDWHINENLFFASDRLKAMLANDFNSDGTHNWCWHEIVHPDDVAHYRKTLETHKTGDQPRWECEYRLRDASGQWRWMSDHGTLIRDGNGRVTRLVGAVRDITEIRDAQLELERTRSRLMASLAAIADGILLVDPDDRVELFNDRYVEIFGNAAGGADMADVIRTGRSVFDMMREGYNLGMFKPHPDGVDAWIKARIEAWDQPVAEWELELSNGTWVLLNERRMPDGGRVSVYTDITDFKRREDEAHAARQRFEEAIEAISSGFALWDADDRLIISNARYRQYFAALGEVVVPGALFTDIIAAGLERGLFPLSDGDIPGYLARIAEKRLSACGEIREQFLQDMWVQITDHRTGDGGIVSIYTDVTELKTKQLEIEQQSAILKMTLENMGQGITMVDQDLNTLALNQKFMELMDFPAEEFGHGFTMEQAFRYYATRGEYGPGDVEQQVRERLVLSRQFKAHKFERTRPDGSVIEVVGNPIDGGGFVSTYTDITERKRGAENLNAALAEFNAVLDNIDYGVLFMDPDLHVRIVNRAFRDIWNIPQGYIDEHPTLKVLIEYNRQFDYYDVSPEDWDGWIDDRVRAVRAGDIAPTEVRRKDGTVVSYQCVALPDGGRMLTYFDITELKNREAELSKSKESAERALDDLKTAQASLVHAEKMASLGQLTAGIAHEIKNPLNFVNNFAKLSAEMMDELIELVQEPIAALDKDDRDDAEDLIATVKENLIKIDQHGRRADSIVKNMLLHSRQGSGEKQVVDLNALTREGLNLAYHGARAADKGFNVDLQVDLSDDVGQIECLPQDLQRVILNLCSNGMYEAVKHSKSVGGPAVLTVSTARVGDRYQVTVSDNGGGIPVDARDKIFTPFFTTKPTGEGTGLGLSMSFDIVKQHGGELSFQTELTKGTAFCLSVPIYVAPDRQ